MALDVAIADFANDAAVKAAAASDPTNLDKAHRAASVPTIAGRIQIIALDAQGKAAQLQAAAAANKSDADLAARATAAVAIAADLATAADAAALAAKIKAELLRRLQAEIQNDPKQLGYAGKTSTEIADLLNPCRTVTSVSPSRIATICFPQTPPTATTVAGLIGDKTPSQRFAGTTTLGALCELELASDPTRRGYLASVGNDAAVLAKLSAPITTTREVGPPRWIELTSDLPYAPNGLTAADIDAVQAVQATVGVAAVARIGGKR